MVLYLSDWTNIGFSFIFLTVNLFRHSTIIEHGLYLIHLETLLNTFANKADPDQADIETAIRSGSTCTLFYYGNMISSGPEK